MCFSCMSLFLHALIFALSIPLWCQGLAAACDCGTPTTFGLKKMIALFPFSPLIWKNLDRSAFFFFLFASTFFSLDF